MGLNIKVNPRSAGPGHESTNAETQRSHRGVLGVWWVDSALDEDLLKAIQGSDMVSLCTPATESEKPQYTRSLTSHHVVILTLANLMEKPFPFST